MLSPLGVARSFQWLCSGKGAAGRCGGGASGPRTGGKIEPRERGRERRGRLAAPHLQAAGPRCAAAAPRGAVATRRGDAKRVGKEGRCSGIGVWEGRPERERRGRGREAGKEGGGGNEEGGSNEPSELSHSLSPLLNSSTLRFFAWTCLEKVGSLISPSIFPFFFFFFSPPPFFPARLFFLPLEPEPRMAGNRSTALCRQGRALRSLRAGAALNSGAAGRR